MESLKKPKEIEILRQELSEFESQIESSDFNGIIYFISFDLVNSTEYKNKHPENWLELNKFFYSEVLAALKVDQTNEEDPVMLWGYRGDEILLLTKVSSIKKLFECTIETHKALINVINKIEKYYKDTKNFLSVKGTAWIAHVSTNPSKAKNILINPQNDLDVLGHDIDIGFRIAHYTHRKILAIDSNLAYILKTFSDKDQYKEYNIEDKLKIVSYEKLKGVWDQRRYPIVWYSDEWDSIIQSFYYDEIYENPILERISEGKIDDINKIIDIYRFVSKEEDLANMISIIERSESDIELLANRLLKQNACEVHCVAICFNQAGKILIAKRTSDERYLPNKWQFGCCKLQHKKHFDTCLKERYKADFNAKIDIIVDKPLTTYFYTEKSVPGIRFIAKLLNSEDEVTENTSRKAHSKIKWFDPSELDSINDDDYIPDFKNIVKMAVDIYDTWKEDKNGG